MPYFAREFIAWYLSRELTTNIRSCPRRPECSRAGAKAFDFKRMTQCSWLVRNQNSSLERVDVLEAYSTNSVEDGNTLCSRPSKPPSWTEYVYVYVYIYHYKGDQGTLNHNIINNFPSVFGKIFIFYTEHIRTMGI